VEYKYLAANLLGLLPLIAALLYMRRLRRTAIVCGIVLCLYCPPVSWLYEGVYWSPARVFGGSWGLEDLMFCFHAGAISWLCALGPWPTEITMRWVQAAGRLLIVTLFAIVGLVSLLWLGAEVLAAFLVVQTASTTVLLIMRPSYLRFIVSAVPMFMAYYFVLLGVWRALMPDFMQMWTGTELGGSLLLGVPLEEYVWVASFCVGYPVTMAFALDVRNTRPGQPSIPVARRNA